MILYIALNCTHHNTVHCIHKQYSSVAHDSIYYYSSNLVCRLHFLFSNVVNSVQCTLASVHFTLCTLYSTLYSLHFKLNTLHFTELVCIVKCRVESRIPGRGGNWEFGYLLWDIEFSPQYTAVQYSAVQYSCTL